MDPQSIEILGRHRLINELVSNGIEVAQPIRDRGIDLIAYLDRDKKTGRFTAVPIQMKAASSRSFTIDKKYAKTSNLIIAYVWGVEDQKDSRIFALTYAEVIQVGKKMGWSKTESLKRGRYSTTAPSKRLIDLLKPFEMTGERWRDKINAALE